MKLRHVHKIPIFVVSCLLYVFLVLGFFEPQECVEIEVLPVTEANMVDINDIRVNLIVLEAFQAEQKMLIEDANEKIFAK